MRVLVTGHDGYIGSVLCRVLQRAGHDVVGLDSFFFEPCTLDISQSWPAQASLRQDVRDVLQSELQGFDAICHLAALSNDPLGDLRSEWTYEINHIGSLRLARLAKSAGVSRFLFSSSCSMYGANTNNATLTEEAPLRPLTAYAETKVALERDLNDLADEQFSPTFLRNCTAYGMSPKLRGDVVLNNLTAWAYTTGRVQILSDGTPWRPIVHVEDICRAFAAILTAPRDIVHNQAFNVGRDEENYQVRDLAAIVEREVPDCKIEYAAQGGPDPRSYRVSFAKLTRTFPELQLRWTAELGVRELYRAFCEHGLRREDLENGRLIRLQQLRRLLRDERLDENLRWKTSQQPAAITVLEAPTELP